MPRLLLKFNDELLKVIDSNKDLITIGRNLKNDLQIDNLAVSNYHAHIICQLGHYFVEDLGSTNGTFVNDRKIGKWALTDNDIVTVGKHTLIFLDAEIDSDTVGLEELQLDKTMILDTPRQRERLARTEPQAEAAPSGPPGRLEVLAGSTDQSSYELTSCLTLIGKDELAEVHLQGFLAPKVGCYISRDRSGYGLIPPEKKSRIRLNGQEVKDAMPLKNGDQIEVASYKFLLTLS